MYPSMANRRRSGREKGFTLLEMLVALSVFSLAALALVKLTGENLRTTGIVEARIFAHVVAENRAVEALTDAAPPALGETEGTEQAAERIWRWTRHVSETAEPGILRVDVAVRSEDGDQVLGEVTIFRGRR
jgi:general secretion pathway protein I